MVAEFEQLNKRLKAKGYDSAANILGSVARSLYKEGLLPPSLEQRGTIFELQKDNEHLFHLDGTTLKSFRIAQGLTQREIAEGAEVSRGYISQLESGIGLPSLQTAEKIANVLQVELTELQVRQNEEEV